MKGKRCSCMRGRLMEFLILCSHELEVYPRVKYSALAIFAERFYPSLSRLQEENAHGSWLLHPMSESNLQLFALTSIWISSKFHGSPPLSVKHFKFLGDKYIKEQHFTTRDFKEAELILMQVLDFSIGTLSIALVFLEELLDQLKGISLTGECIKLEACCDIMDLLYEKEETFDLFSSPRSLAASVLVAAYVITVPTQRWEFPVLPWDYAINSEPSESVVLL
ncbi:hypothetical protein M9H77_08948 [Catharanthus roseus]|uniref:Uncharacterized protein n=1 Tax=Catharanthus roseus TaxID=4058 RepID=A0ACC0BZP3_CATRO|nr:hypothetical protein M9H77_08948 [Catharanthus roseus]